MNTYMSTYGRLTNDPKAIQTKSGKPMTVANVAVDLHDRNAEDGKRTWYVGLVAFSYQAEALLGPQKSSPVTAAGRLQSNGEYQGKEQYSLVVDSLVAAGKRRKPKPDGTRTDVELDAEFRERLYAPNT